MFWETVSWWGKRREEEKGSDLGGRRKIFGACLSRADQLKLAISSIDQNRAGEGADGR